MRWSESDLRHLVEHGVPFNRTLGVRCHAVAEGEVTLALPVKPDFVGDPTRPALHGGVISALLDAAGGFAAWTSLGPHEAVSTVDIRVDYLEPGGLDGDLLATATLIRKGNRVCHVRMTAVQGDRRIAEGLGVYNIHQRRG